MVEKTASIPRRRPTPPPSKCRSMRLRRGSKLQELDDKMAEISPQEQSIVSTACEQSCLPVDISALCDVQ